MAERTNKVKNPAERVIERSELASILAERRAGGEVVVFTNGCFDLLHVGHVRYLTEARNLGDLLVVGLNSDRSISRIKGQGRPVLPQQERAELLASLAAVDYVTIFDEDNPRSIVTELKPNILVKGGDWELDRIIGREEVEQDGGRVVRIPYLEGRSTTAIIQSIRSGNR